MKPITIPNNYLGNSLLSRIHPTCDRKGCNYKFKKGDKVHKTTSYSGKSGKYFCDECADKMEY